MTHPRWVGCIAALAVGLGGCTRDVPQGGLPVVEPPDAPVIHELALMPGGRVVATTDRGLYRVDPVLGLVPLGRMRRNLEGLAATGAAILVSGHAARNDVLPPQIGLLESVTAGRRWRPAGLLGAADLHTIRISGRILYGLDGSMFTLLARDKRQRWTVRTSEPLLDFAVDPRNAHRLIASSTRGLLFSHDGGRQWRLLRRDIVGGSLTWPAGTAPLVATVGGKLEQVTAAGRLVRRGVIGGQPVAITATRSGRRAWAALRDGRVMASSDGGRTWSELPRRQRIRCRFACASYDL